MAARRLLILMLVVLAASTLAAALLAPPPESETTTTTTGEADVGDAGNPRTGSGRLVQAELNASEGRSAPIRLGSGDQLSLIVRSRTAGQIEIPAFGLIDDVGRDDPARFDLLAERPGVFEVRIAGSGRVAGRIVVDRPPPSHSNRGRPKS
jgi:hypothetical protein